MGAPRIWACASVDDEQSSPPEAGYRRQRRLGLEGGWCDDAVLNHQVEGYKESVQHKHCAAVLVIGGTTKNNTNCELSWPCASTPHWCHQATYPSVLVIFQRLAAMVMTTRTSMMKSTMTEN